MKKYLNKIQTAWQSVVISLLVFAPVLVKAAVNLTPEEEVRCKALKAQFKGIYDSLPDQYCSANALMLWVIQQGLVFAGVVAVLFVMLGGFWYLTSAGNEEMAEKGQKTLTNAIIGLVVIILAATIVRIVANTVIAK
ncbi:MAG: pilin [Candidatus Doudnabacteria bacterium]|jgi:hypothetical protein